MSEIEIYRETKRARVHVDQKVEWERDRERKRKYILRRERDRRERENVQRRMSENQIVKQREKEYMLVRKGN